MDWATLINMGAGAVTVVTSWRTERARQRDAVFGPLEMGEACWNGGRVEDSIVYFQSAAELEIRYRCLSDDEEAHLFCNTFAASTYRHRENALRYFKHIPLQYQWLPEVQSNFAFHYLNTRDLHTAYQASAYLMRFGPNPQTRSGELARLIQLGPQTKGTQVYPAGIGYRPPIAVLLSACYDPKKLRVGMDAFDAVELMLEELGPGTIMTIVTALKRARSSRFSKWVKAFEDSNDFSPEYDEAHRHIAMGKYYFLTNESKSAVGEFKNAYELNRAYTRQAISDTTEILFPDITDVRRILMEEFNLRKSAA